MILCQIFDKLLIKNIENRSFNKAVVAHDYRRYSSYPVTNLQYRYHWDSMFGIS